MAYRDIPVWEKLPTKDYDYENILDNSFFILQKKFSK